LAIGVFDGLHLGHQEVIRAAQEHAAQHHGTAVVMSFEPHPLRVLRPEHAPRRLMGDRYKAKMLEGMGISWSLLCPFDRATADKPAEEFLAGLVGSCRSLGCVSVGYAWEFGRGRGGNIHLLMDWGQVHGFAVYGVPPISVGGEVVSSTLIRDAIGLGDLERAGRLLGRPYGLYGRVLMGKRLGRQLGFPTANVLPEAELLPPYGVYSVRVEVDGVWVPGIANLGVRPTFEQGAAALLEAHLFDWEGDLYERELEVRLASFLRPERRFVGIDELKGQIERDVATARAELAKR